LGKSAGSDHCPAMKGIKTLSPSSGGLGPQTEATTAPQ